VRPGIQNNNLNLGSIGNTILHHKTVLTTGVQSLPTGVPDDRLKLRVTIDQKYQQQGRRQGMSICPQQLTPPAKVPSSPTCSSPERGGEQDSLYGDGYSKIYNRLEGWGQSQYQSYQERYNSQFYAQRSSPAMYARQQIKQEPMHGLPVAVKTEPKPEPVDTYSTPSLADLDGITDLLPMQTDFGGISAAILKDVDNWDQRQQQEGEERGQKWELPVSSRWPLHFNQAGAASPANDKWESNSVASSNSSHFDFSSNTDEVFSHIGIREPTPNDFVAL